MALLRLKGVAEPPWVTVPDILPAVMVPEKARANIWEYTYQPASKDLSEKAKANIWEYTYQLEPQRPDAARPTPGFGDDRRQSIQEARDRHAPAPSHAPGYNKALPSEW